MTKQQQKKWQHEIERRKKQKEQRPDKSQEKTPILKTHIPVEKLVGTKASPREKRSIMRDELRQVKRQLKKQKRGE